MERSWQKPPRIFEDPRNVDTYLATGVRNDGQVFAARLTNAPEIPQHIFEKTLLDYLGSFLLDDCHCVVGKNCEMHKEQELEEVS